MFDLIYFQILMNGNIIGGDDYGEVPGDLLFVGNCEHTSHYFGVPLLHFFSQIRSGI